MRTQEIINSSENLGIHVLKEIGNTIVDINRGNDGAYRTGYSEGEKQQEQISDRLSDPSSRPPNTTLSPSTNGTRTGVFRRIVSRDLQADIFILFDRILATWRQGKLEKIGYFRFRSVNSRNTAENLGKFAKVLKSQLEKKKNHASESAIPTTVTRTGWKEDEKCRASLRGSAVKSEKIKYGLSGRPVTFFIAIT